MNQENKENLSCKEIIALLNELIDGEMDMERYQQAQQLVNTHPECLALYKTLDQTVRLYRQRSREANNPPPPIIDWEKLELQQQDNQEEMDSRE